MKRRARALLTIPIRKGIMKSLDKDALVSRTLFVLFDLFSIFFQISAVRFSAADAATE